MGQVQHPQGWRRAHTLGMLGVTGVAAAAVVLALPNEAASFGELDAPCSEVAANCQVGDLAASVLALGSNGSTIFAADNITPTSSGPATDFCFWALYNSNVPGTDNIVISFYNDTGNLTSNGFPVGPALGTYPTADLAVTRADTGLDFAGLDIWEYQVTYTGGSAVNLTAGQCVWVEISNAVAPADAWFILCSDVAAALGDDRCAQRGATATWGYNEIVTGSDIALCINQGVTSGTPDCALPASCTGALNECNAESGSAGCADSECCALVCTVEPTCCSAPWDSVCVDIAINGVACAVAPYNCAGGGPANDCATSPTTITVDGGPVAFDLTTANTDGASLNVSCNGGDSPATFDLWYKVVAPADGRLLIDTCATNVATDLVVNIHNIGNGTYDPQDVLDENNWADCDDDGCCPASFGCPSKKLLDVTEGTNYLIRVGTWNGSTPGPGFIDVSFVPGTAVWNTGSTVPFLNNGAPAQIGFSSGNLGGTNPERWLAQPFVMPAVPAGGSTWHVTSLSAQGFAPAGVTNTTLNYIVWERTGIGQAAGRPVEGDILVSGSAPYPVAIGDDHEIEVDFTLAPGDYWLTVYAAGATPPSNFAWFVNAQNGPDGLPNLADGTTAGLPAGDPFMWRSFCVTAASLPSCGANPTGFQPYELATATVDAGQDPLLLYTASFKIYAEPELETGCPQDCVTSATLQPPPDGIVDGADLAVLIGAWGNCPGCCSDSVTSATLLPPPDGVVDGADLAVLIGAWGNPGCQ